MIIRSQNKKLILNFDNVSGVYIDEKVIITATVNDNDYAFGVYSTEEKAIKVLDMIQNAYFRQGILKTTYTSGFMTKLERDLGFDGAKELVSPVFQMPADEDVEV